MLLKIHTPHYIPTLRQSVVLCGLLRISVYRQDCLRNLSVSLSAPDTWVLRLKCSFPDLPPHISHVNLLGDEVISLTLPPSPSLLVSQVFHVFHCINFKCGEKNNRGGAGARGEYLHTTLRISFVFPWACVHLVLHLCEPETSLRWCHSAKPRSHPSSRSFLPVLLILEVQIRGIIF